jgi:AhpD family alkylhydroperoxidase
MRIDPTKVAPGAMQAMLGLERYLEECGIDKRLLLMMKLRASQMNGCAYCIDMHWKDARALGESEQRLYGLDAWREFPFYSEREQAAFAWTEAVTRLDEGHVPDDIYEQARAQFNDKELADLTLAVAAINAWNRLTIPLRVPGGSYQPKAR